MADSLNELSKRFKDVGPNWSRLPYRINFADKYKRGVGLSYKEAAQFGGICNYGGPAQIAECYGEFSYDNESYNSVDVSIMCAGCRFHNKSDVYDPNVSAGSIFDAFAINRYFENRKICTDPPYGAFVYFITDEANNIKIGIAQDPWKRIGDLQVGNAKTLNILYLIGAKNIKDAQRMENLLHALYRTYLIRGEWFSIYQHLDHSSFETIYSPNNPWIKEAN